MLCPNCITRRLRRFNINDSKVIVDACKQCGGVWFDEGELKEVLDVAVQDMRIRNDVAESDRNCPKCDRALMAFNYPRTKVRIDSCSDCLGLWLDAGEFKAIKAARAQLTQMTDSTSTAKFFSLAENVGDDIRNACKRKSRQRSQSNKSFDQALFDTGQLCPCFGNRNLGGVLC